MNRARLVKLTVDNFKRFSHVVLELENFTSISGKTMSKGENGNLQCFDGIFMILSNISQLSSILWTVSSSFSTSSILITMKFR